MFRGVLPGVCYLETSKGGSVGGRRRVRIRGRGKRRRSRRRRRGGEGTTTTTTTTIIIMKRRRRRRSAGAWLTLQRSQHSDSCG